MYKSGIIAAASATETLAGPNKPGQIIELRQDSMRRSKGSLALFARDLMTSPAVVAESGAAVHEVARLMLQEGVSAVPVINDLGVAIGIASDGDLRDADRTISGARGGSPFRRPRRFGRRLRPIRGAFRPRCHVGAPYQHLDRRCRSGYR